MTPILDRYRRKLRMFCFDKDLVLLFLVFSNREEKKNIEESLNFIDKWREAKKLLK